MCSIRGGGALRALQVVLAVLTVAGSARDAQAAPARSAPGNAEARPWARGVSAEAQARALARFRQGNTLLAEAQFDRALQHYRAALRSWNHPAIHYNAVICLVRLKRPVAALRHLGEALRYGRAPLGKNYEQALTYRTLLQGQLSRLEVRCPEPGATVTVDGKPVLTGPGRRALVLPPGHHQVVVRKAGFLTRTQRVLALPGKPVRVSVRPLPLEEGVTVKRRWPRWMPWTVLALGVVVAAAGAPLSWAAQHDIDQYDQVMLTECSKLPSGGCDPGDVPEAAARWKDRAKRAEAGAIALYALGGLTAAAGALLALFNRPRPVEAPTAPSGASSASRFRIPLAAPVPGGVVVRFDGRF